MIIQSYLKGIFLFLIVFISMESQSQEWVELMLQPDANFYEIQEAFQSEWGEKEYERGKGYKQYKRWENYWETRILEDGSFPTKSRNWGNFKRLLSKNQNKSGGVGNWQPLGPFSHDATGSWSPGTGRVNCVVEDPNDPNTLYIGAPAGGVWKSIDAGASWIPLGDELSVIGVTGIAIDANNSNIIYLATGDSDGGDTYSVGVLKSLDGGNSWGSVGNVAGKTTEILIDPTNSNVLYLASSSGVYKSTDAGASWSNLQSGNFRDIEMKPGFSNVLYAVTSSSFYVSTNSGTSWSVVTSGLPAASGRLAIATTAANLNYVYVLSADTDYGFQGVYRSTNSAGSFTAMNTTTDIFESTQAWYDMAIAASQTNANEIVTGVLNVWRSTNGGSSFTQLNSWSSPSGAAYTHADIHYLKYYGNNLYCGSDGGIYKSTNSGNSFTDLSVGLQIGQFYRIGGSQNDVNTIAGGLQDNGGYVLKSGVWKVYYGADGMEAGVDRNNSNLIFGMIQYGGLYRSSNGGNSSSGEGSPMEGRWVTPMQMDPNNDRLLAGYDDLHEFDYASGWNQLSTFTFPEQLRCIEIFEGNSNIIFVSTDDNIYRTTNNGGTFTDITGTLPTTSVITSIEVNPANSDEIWISRGGWDAANHIYHTIDGGVNWINITDNLPNLPCNIVKYDVGTNGGIYVGTDIGVYYKDNDLGNWIQFMNNLPNVIVNDLEINENTNVIRAGTYGRGVWESPNYNANDYDAGISSIISPESSICNTTSFIPVVALINYGLVNLTSVDINYDIDGGGSQVYNWTGNLAQGGTVDVTLPSISTVNGVHVFNASTSSPSGQIDEAPNNNFMSKSFNVILSGTPVSLVLNTDCWGSETSWQIQDLVGAVVTSGGPYSDNSGGDSFIENFCLEDGCYDFIINDSYGDGINGTAYGCVVDGDYVITDDQSNILVQMFTPVFDFQAIHNFCISGAGASLIAGFTSSATTVCEGTMIDFTDTTSTGTPTSWGWVFNGAIPSTSTSQNPTGILYSTPGTYTVELTVSDGVSSNTIASTAYVTVGSIPSVITIPVAPTCGMNNGEIFTNSSGGTGVLSFSWSNGDTGSIITDLSAGTYTVTVFDSVGCTIQATEVLSNISGPVAVVSSNQVICNGDLVTISASGAGLNGTYSWNQGLGAGNTHVVSPSLTTSYTVVVTDSNGCDDFASILVQVNPVPVIIAIPDSASICEGSSIVLTVISSSDVLWSTGESTSSIVVSPTSSTTYSVTGQTGNCISDTSFVVVEMSLNSVAIAGADALNIVVGGMVNFNSVGSVGSLYNWDFGDGGSSLLDSPSYTYSTIGIYTVVLEITEGNCISTDTLVINVDATGIFENEEGNEIFIYPNPVIDNLNVTSLNEMINVKYEIIDAQGKKVKDGFFTKGSVINVGFLDRGVYLIHFENENSRVIQFVKE